MIDNSTYGELQRWHIEQVQQRQGNLLENLANRQTMFDLINRSPLLKNYRSQSVRSIALLNILAMPYYSIFEI